MNLIIVGGGTAGWLSALTLQKIFRNLPVNITLVESEDIGIVGVGEGSVPFLTTFLFNSLELPLREFIKETNSAFKLGISFENWNGDNQKYFHPFSSAEINNIKGFLGQNKPLIEHPHPQFAYRGMSPFAVNKTTNKWESILAHSYHFDAHLVASFFRKHALARGVKRVQGKIQTLKTDKDNNITKILLDNNTELDSTFVFDCTGFHRLIIGKHYNTKWVSYQDYLPIKLGLPFHLPQDDHILPYTHAVAMKYGWMWKIPLKHRFGCGYVFDSNYITPDQAKEEVEQLLGYEINATRTIDFKAGRYEQMCRNNCIGIGLSIGFTEPIEATSILTSMLMLTKLSKLAVRIILKNEQSAKDELNNYFEEINNLIVPFLHAHYLTKRDDSLFWKEFKHNTKTPPVIQELLERQKHTPIEQINIVQYNYIFGFVNWVWVLEGLGLLNKSFYLPEEINPSFDLQNYNLVTTRQFLNTIDEHAFE